MYPGRQDCFFFFKWTSKKFFAKSSWVAVASINIFLILSSFVFLLGYFQWLSHLHLHLDVICPPCQSYHHPLSLNFVASSSIWLLFQPLWTIKIFWCCQILNLLLLMILFGPPKPNPYQSHPNWHCTCYVNVCKLSPSPTCGAMECLLFE
jgi:hypothetical protein